MERDLELVATPDETGRVTPRHVVPLEEQHPEPFAGQPAEEHKPGYFSLTFRSTGSTKPVRQFRPAPESFIQSIKVVQNQYSTKVGFTLKDGRLQLVDRLSFSSLGNSLQVGMSLPASQDSSTQTLFKEAGQTIGGIGAAASGGAQAPSGLGTGNSTSDDFWWTFVIMMIALALIVAVLYGVAIVYNRYFRNRLTGAGGPYACNQLAAYHIGPRQKVVVLEINGEIMACGVTPHQITLLTKLQNRAAKQTVQAKTPKGQATAKDPAPRPAAERTLPADNLAAERAIITPAQEGGKGDAVHQFADVLKQKVRSLKRIN